MSPLLKIAVGLLCGLLLHLADLIERMNALLREYLLNDAHVALERRKWGMFFLLVAFLFLYIGWTAGGR